VRREMTIAVIIGLVWGSGMLAPGAVFRPTASAPQEAARNQPIYLPQAPEAERPLSYYGTIDERDLFRPAVAPRTPPPKAALPNFPGGGTGEAAPWESPLQGWTYAGYAALDGVPVVILQESSSGQAAFLHQGDNFRGGLVEEITPESVRMTFGEHLQTMPKSDEYNTVPLTTAGEAAAPSPSPRPRYGTPSAPAPVSLPPRAVMSPASAFRRPYADASTSPEIMQRAAQLRAEWEARRRQMMERTGPLPGAPAVLPPTRSPNRPLPTAPEPESPAAEPSAPANVQQ